MNQCHSSEITRRDFLKSTALASSGINLIANTSFAASKKKLQPNILYLMTDQHRGDCLGCAGNKIIKTPHLDSIAEDGVLFPNAYSSTPSCTPARSALLTGLSPWHHGMIGYGRVADKYPFELPQAIRDAGYYVFGIGKMHWYPQRKLRGYHDILLDESGRAETPGFVSDYRFWFKQQAPELNPDATGIGWNDYRAKTYALPERLHPTKWTADRAVDFIEKYNRSKPFLLKVSFARPHSPYDPPKRFMDMYSEDEMPKPYVGDWADMYAEHEEPPNTSLWHGDLGIQQAKISRRGYYASITFIDEQIGRILETLKKRDIYDNTLIILFSDHGDMLGDHHLWRKTYAYEASARIPMLLRWPRRMGMKNKRGKKLPQPVELRDVLPTFLDAAGAPVPNHLDGKSMLDLVRGNTKNWRQFIDLEHSMCYNKDHWNALTDGRFKYIYYAYDGREQLFDLRKDPGELNDLAAESSNKSILLKWRQRMVEHLSERGEQFVSDGKLAIRKKRYLYSPHFPKNS
ncbi:MAG: arylsulfatase [Planctomycetes bacterium]|nr:arylsulfatase [Planctomycetota bacterium]MBL7145427.1 arylsulfatase [Phycisphaerae bacterium]